MSSIDLSPEALERLKALAQKATPEFIREGYFIYGPKHPASKHPNRRILIAHIIEGSNQRDPCLDGGAGIVSGKDDAAYIAAAHPGVILAICEEIERLREQVALLNKEAEWLAQRASKEKCPSSTKSIHCENVDPQNCAACWRDAARKAVEGACTSK